MAVSSSRTAACFSIKENFCRVGSVGSEALGDRGSVGEPEDAHGVQDQEIRGRVLGHLSVEWREASRVECCWHA